MSVICRVNDVCYYKLPQYVCNNKTMSIMTKYFIAAISCFVFSIRLLLARSIPSNQLVVSSKTVKTPFLWQGDSIRSEWEAHVAMLIPVTLQNCSRTFYMQFDTGSPYSLLYNNKIASIRSKYPKSIPLGAVNGRIQDFTFKVGKTLITGKEMVVNQFDSTHVDWEGIDRIEIIGTIGSDLIDNKTLIIDYPNNKIIISEKIPEKILKNMELEHLVYSNGNIVLPATIQEAKTLLYFDTGSSMFELLTSKKTCEELAMPDAKRIKYDVKSWDRVLVAHSLASNAHITIANTVIPIKFSAYIDGVSNSQVEYMSKMGMGGMTGNKLFLNHILVLDTKNQKFGLISTASSSKEVIQTN